MAMTGKQQNIAPTASDSLSETLKVVAADSVSNRLSVYPAAAATHLELQQADLGLLRVGHYGWVKDNQAVVARISNWLAKHLADQ